MDKNMLSTAGFNSALLAIMFLFGAIRAVKEERGPARAIAVAVSIAAAIFTLVDAVKFYKLT